MIKAFILETGQCFFLECVAYPWRVQTLEPLDKRKKNGFGGKFGMSKLRFRSECEKEQAKAPAAKGPP